MTRGSKAKRKTARAEAQDEARAETGEPLASRLRLFALRYARARMASEEAGR